MISRSQVEPVSVPGIDRIGASVSNVAESLAHCAESLERNHNPSESDGALKALSNGLLTLKAVAANENVDQDTREAVSVFACGCADLYDRHRKSEEPELSSPMPLEIGLALTILNYVGETAELKACLTESHRQKIFDIVSELPNSYHGIDTMRIATLFGRPSQNGMADRVQGW